MKQLLHTLANYVFYSITSIPKFCVFEGLFNKLDRESTWGQERVVIKNTNPGTRLSDLISPSLSFSACKMRIITSV